MAIPSRSVARLWRQARTVTGYALLAVFLVLLGGVVLPLSRRAGGATDEREVRAERIVHWTIRVWLRLLTWMGILRIEVSGAERLRTPGTLVVANHPTLLDALVLMAVMPAAGCVVKQEYCRNPLLGGVVRGAGYIPMTDGPEVVAACTERLVRGRSLVVFPEGTRSPVGGLGPFQRGAAHIALRAGCDPVPVTVRCDPPTLHHGHHWLDVPERRFTLRLEAAEPLPVKEIAGQHQTYGRSARALTRAMREHFERRIPGVRA